MRHRFRLFLCGSALLLSACSETSPPATPAVATTAATFVGSAVCGSCHEAQSSDWQGSHHQLAMQVADDNTVLGDFDNSSFDYFDTQTHFLRDNGNFVVRTENADGDIEDFVIAFVFGVEPLQQYLVEFPSGRMQSLPFAWDTREQSAGGQRWYHLYPDEYIGPGDELHWTGRYQNWNYMCAECHSTNVAVNYDVTQDRFDTTWFEINVGCEACHGPASKHVENAQTGMPGDDSGLLVSLDDHGRAVWQMNPDTGIAQRSQLAMRPPQQPESCGRCHARRGVVTAEYEYGKPLMDTHRPALLNDPLYYSDGQIRDEVYVYGSFLQSRMYQAGVTCSDCHNPHSLKLVTGNEPSDVCAQCHLPTVFASTEHHQHAQDQVACVDCHMPSRVYMGVDARRDHSMRIPRPELSLDGATPNACEHCHADQDAAWLVAKAGEWWGAAEESNDAMMPGIVRATLLTTLPMPLSPESVAAIESGANNADPLVRMAALQSAQALPPQQQLNLAAPLLDDAVRSVRLEAVRLLAPFRQYLPATADAAFVAAAEEFRAAQFAIASVPEAFAALSQFEADLGNIDKALEHSRQALRMNPDFAMMRHSLGLLLVRSGRADEALPELREAVRLEPGVSRFIYVLAVALNSMGEPDEAIDLLEQARRNFPDDYDIAWALATMQRDLGNIERATELAHALLQQYPDDQNVTALLGSLQAN
jgi:tetratricopeptide (TPR) repeat protein